MRVPPLACSIFPLGNIAQLRSDWSLSCQHGLEFEIYVEKKTTLSTTTTKTTTTTTTITTTATTWYKT